MLISQIEAKQAEKLKGVTIMNTSWYHTEKSNKSKQERSILRLIFVRS
jgi:hypothetical protein